MRNKKLIIGILLTGLLIGGSCFQTSCIADDSQLTSLEQANVNYTEMEQYIRRTKRGIMDNWYPPTSSFENSAILGLTIDRKGTLVKCSLIKPSPNEGFNNSLIEAAQKTKFMPLPNDFIEDVVDLSIEFGMQRRSVKK